MIATKRERRQALARAASLRRSKAVATWKASPGEITQEIPRPGACNICDNTGQYVGEGCPACLTMDPHEPYRESKVTVALFIILFCAIGAWVIG